MKTFDWQEYLKNNPDLKKAGIDNESDALKHFLNYGITEERPYGRDFLLNALARWEEQAGIEANNSKYKSELKRHNPNTDFVYDNTDFIDKEVSVVVGYRNRAKMLSISIHSWLHYPQIKEIIITDWSSPEPIDHIEKIDSRIKVIRVNDQPFYNASTPVNIAIKQANCPVIMKLDVDHIINPYGNFNSLININQDEFICGNHRKNYLDNGLGFVKGANGYLCVYKDRIEEVGYYDESIENYGHEDCEMFERLVKLGLKRKTLNFHPKNIPLYHNPHGDFYRTMCFKEKDLLFNYKQYGEINLDE